MSFTNVILSARSLLTVRKSEPGYSDVDLSVFKNTKVTEKVTLQLRAELFNVFNRTNFAPPSVSYATTTDPVIGATVYDPNNSGLTLFDTIGDYNGAPGIGAGEAFNAQLGAKIIF